MTPTSFEFTLTLPGDARLVDAVRGLTAHAAGYALLGDSARDGLASQVAAATQTAIAAARGSEAPIDVRFTGDDQAITVVISCEAQAAAPRPRSTTATTDEVSVDWETEGSRHVCHIRRRISA
jgi:hypothetical protein